MADEEFHKQNDYLRQQLHALNSGSPARRRKFQMFVVRCGGCDDVLAEVMRTEPFPILHTRRTGGHPSTPVLPAGTPAGQLLAQMKDQPQSFRRDAWSFRAIPWPLPEPSPDDHANVSTTCRCRNVELSQAAIFADLRAGVTKRIHPMPRHGVT